MPARATTPPCRIYGIKNCDTMRKAFAWLDANGVACEFVDYKKAGVVEAHLPDWNRRVGWDALLNMRGLTWRRLSDAQRRGIDEATALELMIDQPTLIRRPLLDTGKSLLVGLDPASYERELKQ
ncbi:MAG: arsenate reductase [Propionivibrio sp.]